MATIDGSLPTGHYEMESNQAARKREREEAGANLAIRKRITRACDQCNALRTKCDGKIPCAHCVDNVLKCDYARVHKRRGRVPKRDHNPTDQSRLRELKGFNNSETVPILNVQPRNDVPLDNGPAPVKVGITHPAATMIGYSDRGSVNLYGDSKHPQTILPSGHNQLDMDPTTGTHNESPDFVLTAPDVYASGLGMTQEYGFPLGDDYSVAFMGKAPTIESPDWMNLSTSIFTTGQYATLPTYPKTLKYPVLQPLLTHIEGIMPQELACDLLEQYFTLSTWSHLRPKNPYIIGNIFRAHSVLHPTKPRPCSLALLSSILWISAQNSDAPLLTSQPDARAQMCRKLLELTLQMLKPLVHGRDTTSFDTSAGTSTVLADAGLEGLAFGSESFSDTSANRNQLDNIVTYMHLGVVVSASERKAASLRWWNAAWSLAREMRLGREVSVCVDSGKAEDRSIAKNSPENQHSFSHLPRSTASAIQARASFSACFMTEEDREERRRVWWLLYTVDRHLALCYNKPLFFLNQECESLLLPLSDEKWQSGAFDSVAQENRPRGLGIQFTSQSVFGFFLPLMVLLGEIIDLNYARNRPRLGAQATSSRNWDEATNEILQYLEEFEHNILAFEQESKRAAQTPSDSTTSPASDVSPGIYVPSRSEARLQADTAVAYAKYTMHVLHILLTGKWDPIAMLDDNDLWISSRSFITATEHAVRAAQCLADIIEYDPDLNLMPYFFGIYLLQGSFLLLLFADKLQGNITSDVVQACETIVRAHEACVATLDTQYQRNFRKVMRSALQQLRGRAIEDATEQQLWRRGILQLYRWTGDGTGLAL